jgi:hypothetical protein
MSEYLNLRPENANKPSAAREERVQKSNGELVSSLIFSPDWMIESTYLIWCLVGLSFVNYFRLILVDVS